MLNTSSQFSDMVSVITPVYNSRQFVSESIRSVLDQTYENWEHILVDDCSTDDSTEIIESYVRKDERIKLICLKENQGAGAARNVAIKESKGRYLAFLDSDDFWDREKLEKQIEHIKKYGAAAIYSQYYIYDQAQKKATHLIQSPPRVDFGKMQKNDYIGFLTLLVDTEKTGKPLMPTIRRRQDWAYKLILLKQGFQAICVPEPLAYYRIGNQSLSSNKFRLVKYNFKVFNKILGYSWTKSMLKMSIFLLYYFIFKKTSRKKVN